MITTAIPVKYIIKRLIIFVSVFFGALTLNFVLPRLMPGNPAEVIYQDLLKASGGTINTAYLHQLEAEYGISTGKPIYVQYLIYLNDLFQTQNKIIV